MEIVYTKNAPEPIGAYSQAVKVGKTLYCSGQIAFQCLDGNIETQTVQICENISAVLAAADADMSKVVKTTCFLTEMAGFAAFNSVYAKYFSHKPARSCIAAKELPKGAKVEIEVIAELE